MVDINNDTNVNVALNEFLRAKSPSARLENGYCVGCFAPRDSLTVRPHINLIWKEDDCYEDGKNFRMKCKFCDTMRIVSLSSFSMKTLRGDIQSGSDFFVLAKDHKPECNVKTSYLLSCSCYNYVAGVNSVAPNSVNILKMYKEQNKEIERRKEGLEKLKNL